MIPCRYFSCHCVYANTFGKPVSILRYIGREFEELVSKYLNPRFNPSLYQYVVSLCETIYPPCFTYII